MDNGWIKIYRQLTDSEIWKVRPFSKGQAWIDLLVLTNHQPGVISTKNGQLIRVARGECGWSELSLSKRWGWSRGKINRFFGYLSEQEMVQLKKVANITIIAICNYERFQDSTINSTTNDTINGHQTVQQTGSKQDTIEEGKEEKERKEGGVPAPACTHTREGTYPQSVAEVLAIASDPRCAMAITREQAEAYFLTRDTVDWVDAAGRKIPAAKIHGDLKRWMLREQQNEKDRGGAANEADEMKRRFEEIRRNGQR